MYKGYSASYPKTISFTEPKAWSVLSQTEIVEFIKHYEKITKWTIKVLPKKANFIAYINKDQMIKKITIA